MIIFNNGWVNGVLEWLGFSVESENIEQLRQRIIEV